MLSITWPVDITNNKRLNIKLTSALLRRVFLSILTQLTLVTYFDMVSSSDVQRYAYVTLLTTNITRQNITFLRVA